MPSSSPSSSPSASSPPSPVNLAARPARFDDRWSPKVVGRFDGHEPMPVEAEGTPNTGDAATAALGTAL